MLVGHYRSTHLTYNWYHFSLSLLFLLFQAQLAYESYWAPDVLVLILYFVFIFVMRVREPVTNINFEHVVVTEGELMKSYIILFPLVYRLLTSHLI